MMSSLTKLSLNMSAFHQTTVSAVRRFCSAVSSEPTSFNRIVLMGRLYRDPHVFYDDHSGTPKSKIFSVYTKLKRKYVKADEEGGHKVVCTDKYNWFNVRLFRKRLLDVNLQQGSGVLIHGHLSASSYLNKNGERIYTTNVIVDDMSLVESPTADFGPQFEKHLLEEELNQSASEEVYPL